MKKILTLVYPLYSPTDIELDNIEHVIESIGNKVEVVILSDNPKFNSSFKDRFNKKKCVFVENKNNKGKYQLIKDAVDQGIIKTKWFKVCDPDDYILFKNIKKFNKKFKNIKKDFLIRFIPSKNIQPGEYKSSEINNNKFNKLITKKYMSSVVNENTVLLTKDLLNFKLEAFNQTKSSDVLFSLSSSVRDDYKVKNFNKSFYIYNKHNGISNTNNQSMEMFNQLLSFLDIMIKYNKQNKMKAPSFFDYKWAHNSLLLMNIDIEEKEKLAKLVFDKLKICAKDNKNWKVNWNKKERKLYTEKMLRNNKRI